MTHRPDKRESLLLRTPACADRRSMAESEMPHEGEEFNTVCRPVLVCGRSDARHCSCLHDVTVVLKPGNALRIRVLDDDGRPLQNARVDGDDWRGAVLFVHFTTDGDGLIEWPEAPAGGVEYHISKPGHCQLFNLKLEASGGVHEITLPRVLQLAGQVCDAKTARPLEKFVSIPVFQFDQGATVTDRRRVQECRDGAVSIDFDRSDVSHALRIEADGYRTQITRFFRIGEPVGDVTIEMQQAAPYTGIVLAPDGRPPTNAEVFLATPTMPVEVSGRAGSGNNNLATKTSEEGRFSFPAQFEPYRVVVVADEGFADVACQADEEPGRIDLQAWSRVSGMVMQAGKAAPGQSVKLKPIVVDDLTAPRVDNFFMTKATSVFRGQWVLLDVWATWCGPCVAAIPEMARLHDEFVGRKDFVLIGLSLDQDRRTAQDFVAKRKLPWLQGFLGDWSETGVPEQLSITLIPAYLLIDPDGRLHTRSTSVAEIRKVLDDMLRANPRQPPVAHPNPQPATAPE